MTTDREPRPQLHTEGDVIHWAAGYDRLLGAMTLGLEGRFRRRVVEAAGLSEGERVLDVGCGTGTLALLASTAVGADGCVEGIDPAPEMIARAQAKAKAKRSSANFQVAAIESLPFEDDSFDVVLSTLMFHHLTGPLQRRGLDELRRVLAPGGRVCIVDFDGGGPLFHRLAAHFMAHHHDEEEHGEGFEALADAARERGFTGVATGRFRPRFLRELRAELPGSE